MYFVSLILVLEVIFPTCHLKCTGNALYGAKSEYTLSSSFWFLFKISYQQIITHKEIITVSP